MPDLSVSKVTSTGEDHGHAVFVGGGNDLIVSYGTAGGNDGPHAGLSHKVEPISKREKRIAGTHGTGGSLAGFPYGDLGRVDPALLPGADPHGGAVDPDHDRVRGNMRAYRPCGPEVLPLLRRRWAIRDNGPLAFSVEVFGYVIGTLHQKPTID